MRLDLETGEGHSANKTVSASVRAAGQAHSGDVVFDYHNGDDSAYSNLTIASTRELAQALLVAAAEAEVKMEKHKTCPACHGTGQR